MPLDRLLLVVLFLSAASAFTQDRQTANIPTGKSQPKIEFSTAASIRAPEPGTIIPNAGKDRDSILRGEDVDGNGIVVSLDRPLAAETTCYMIRAYVVARDSKESDSTHPVRYSTCHPATRYRLKSAQVQDATLER